MTAPPTDPPPPAPVAPTADVSASTWAMAHLADATARLHASLELPRVAEQVIRAYVPRLAAGAVLLLPAEGGFRPVLADHMSPVAHARIIRALPGHRIARSDVAAVLGGVDADRVRRCDGGRVDPEGDEPCCTVVIPGDRAPAGVLRLWCHPVPDPAAGALRQLLAVRAAQALRNARVVQDHAEVVARLRTAVAPPIPSTLHGMGIAARYEAACGTTRSGGDFRDVHDDGRAITAVLGDVQGHGIGAVTTAALCRLALRGLAASTGSPGQLLHRLDQALVDHLATEPDGIEGRFATACAARVTPAGDGTAEVVLASAGHPPAILVTPEGVRPVRAEGMLLGPFPGVARAEVRLRLRPGDALLLASDGVVDAVPDAAAHPWLAAALLDARPGGAASLADALMHATRPDPLAASRHDDDRSALVVALPSR